MVLNNFLSRQKTDDSNPCKLIPISFIIIIIKFISIVSSNTGETIPRMLYSTYIQTFKIKILRELPINYNSIS